MIPSSFIQKILTAATTGTASTQCNFNVKFSYLFGKLEIEQNYALYHIGVTYPLDCMVGCVAG